MTWKLDCGSYKLFVIEDGYYWRDMAVYDERATEHDWRFHPKNDRGQARLNFGCYLITNGDRTIMIDSGIGEIAQEGMTAGLMPQAVDDLGIDRGSVEMVVYTHMHYDHIGGSRRDGQVVFPNARHVFHTKEWDHWKGVESDIGKAARNIMAPLFDADVVDFIDGDTEVLPGVTAVESFGHTPGHLTVSIVSSGTRTIIGGDVSNHPFQVEHPHWSLPVDNDKVKAGQTRDRLFESIKDTDTTFVAGHYPMPGVGKIVTDDGLRVYRPGSPGKVSDRETAGTGPVRAVGDASLDGEWVVTAYRSGDDLVTPIQGLRAPVLTIDGSEISGTMGVNRFSGRLQDGLVAGPLATTRMAGPPESMRQEDELLGHLGKADEISVEGDGMIVAGDGLNLIELRRAGTNGPDDPS